MTGISPKIQAIYCPMSETTFYVLLSLTEPNYGYSISQEVLDLTLGEVRLSPGTLYGSLKKLLQDGLIQVDHQVDHQVGRRRLYVLTELGEALLDIEKRRIRRLSANAQGMAYRE